MVSNLKRLSKFLVKSEYNDVFMFDKWKISAAEVFFLSPLSIGFVNLKPILPGHVLISPKKITKRFKDLTAEEVADLWQCSQLVGEILEKKYECEGLSLVIQDGSAAGQTVEHVHVHVIPRRASDFNDNNDMYTVLEETDFSRTDSNAEKSAHFRPDSERKPRMFQEMEAEAAELRRFMEDLVKQQDSAEDME